MKKKLILHIGFPKCASTTLQESVFFTIQNKDINFLGRSRQLDKSNNYIIGNDLIGNTKKLTLNFDILKEGINIISDELLLVPNSLWNWRERGDKNNALILKKQFEGFVDEIAILIVLRKQENWIYSNYSFNYAKLKERGAYESYDDLIDSLKSNHDLLKEFEFSEWIDPYSKVFGKDNMRFLFVEDLGNINGKSVGELADLLNMDRKDVFELLQRKKNVQPKKEVVIKSTISNKTLIKIWQVYNSNKYLRKLKPIINRLPFLKKSYQLPKITETQKAEISIIYKESNRKFAEKYDLMGIMKHLKYF